MAATYKILWHGCAFCREGDVVMTANLDGIGGAGSCGEPGADAGIYPQSALERIARERPCRGRLTLASELSKGVELAEKDAAG